MLRCQRKRPSTLFECLSLSVGSQQHISEVDVVPTCAIRRIVTPLKHPMKTQVSVPSDRYAQVRSKWLDGLEQRKVMLVLKLTFAYVAHLPH